MGSIDKKEARLRRKKRVRKKIKGTPDRPRLNVFKSSKHIYAQIIDDIGGKTLVSVSSLSPYIRKLINNNGGNINGARVVGGHIAKKALDKGIKRVIFDRNGFLYHGRIKALADAAREGGLEF